MRKHILAAMAFTAVVILIACGGSSGGGGGGGGGVLPGGTDWTMPLAPSGLWAEIVAYGACGTSPGGGLVQTGLARIYWDDNSDNETGFLVECYSELYGSTLADADTTSADCGDVMCDGGGVGFRVQAVNPEYGSTSMLVEYTCNEIAATCD